VCGLYELSIGVRMTGTRSMAISAAARSLARDLVSRKVPAAA
jgi:hypothetical protein